MKERPNPGLPADLANLKFGFWPKKPKISQNDLKFWGHCGYARYFWYHRYHFLKSPPLRGNITSFFPPPVLYSLTQYQASKFSDLSLVSDFFSNFQDHSLDQCKSDDKTFLGGRGGGIWVQWPEMALECINCNSWSQKFSGGEPPHPPVRGFIA